MGTVNQRGALLMITLGVMLILAGVTGRIVVPEHQPVATQVPVTAIQIPGGGARCPGPRTPGVGGILPDGGCTATRWTGTPRVVYDLLRVLTWAALIVGVVLVLLGLIRTAQRTRLA